MAFLRPEDVEELTKIFSGLQREVTVDLAADDLDLQTLIDEVCATGGGKLVLRKHAPDPTRNPSMTLSSEIARGKLYFDGLPVGYEMATFVGALADLGGVPGTEPLVTPDAQAKLDALQSDVKLEVFSTPG